MKTKMSKRQSMPRWYDRERWHYTSDREPIRKYAEYLRLIPWKLYGTFTFPRKLFNEEAEAQAEAQFARFIDFLERNLKSNVAYICGAEKRLSGCGKPASGLHFHVLLTSTADLQPSFVKASWIALTKNADDGAKVEMYDGYQDAAYYVLKMMNHPDGEWSHRKLNLFHPDVSLENINSRKRRSLRRHAEQTKQLRCSQ